MSFQENNTNTEGAIIDGENYRSSQEYGFKDIVMRQLQRVVTNMSQEMRDGFWVYSNSPNMAPQKIRYVGDSRKELKQSIDVLHDLLQPRFDKQMNSSSKTLNEEFDDWHQKWINKEVSLEEQGSYWATVLKIYRTLFQQLCSFLERIGWLESGGIEE